MVCGGAWLSQLPCRLPRCSEGICQCVCPSSALKQKFYFSVNDLCLKAENHSKLLFLESCGFVQSEINLFSLNSIVHMLRD